MRDFPRSIRHEWFSSCSTVNQSSFVASSDDRLWFLPEILWRWWMQTRPTGHPVNVNLAHDDVGAHIAVRTAVSTASSWPQRSHSSSLRWKGMSASVLLQCFRFNELTLSFAGSIPAVGFACVALLSVWPHFLLMKTSECGFGAFSVPIGTQRFPALSGGAPVFPLCPGSRSFPAFPFRFFKYFLAPVSPGRVVRVYKSHNEYCDRLSRGYALL